MRILLVTGADGGLVSREITEIVGECLGKEDRNSALSSFGEQDYLNAAGQKDIGALVDAAQTAPMLASKRVVVGRDLAFLGSTKAMFGPLLEYLENPCPTTDLILVWEKGPTTPSLPAVPTSLTKAVRDIGGEVRKVGGMRGKAVSEWFEDQLQKSNLRIDGHARKRLLDWMGEEPNRLPSVLEVLQSTFGEDEKLGLDHVEPFLAQAGTVPIWDLTDAIDSGDRKLALEKLRRILSAEDGEPLRVNFALHRHFEELLRLDGSGARQPTDAARVLQLPKQREFLAKRKLQQAERLGSDKIASCVKFIADADLDLRGKTGLDPEIVMEVLVARLASQVRWKG